MDRRNVRKIFVQRDYSRGTGVRFSTDFPRELTGKVDETTYRTTIENVNQCFDEAEALGCCNVLEGCLACMTGFALHYCFKTHYERCVQDAAKYIQQQNREVYEQRGIILGDPMDRGLRCVSTLYSH
ncbi:Golgin subfamily A member 7 [Geodia barretti]|uniref:Ras modification protein ERF4 n=1 Tax=Geodia barretti TaxID=519541 RepID=A0AA35SRE0_GEOBA|nr:Golgin subfamily A member 7 [Geodia barretti]